MPKPPSGGVLRVDDVHIGCQSVSDCGIDATHETEILSAEETPTIADVHDQDKHKTSPNNLVHSAKRVRSQVGDDSKPKSMMSQNVEGHENTVAPRPSNKFPDEMMEKRRSLSCSEDADTGTKVTSQDMLSHGIGTGYAYHDGIQLDTEHHLPDVADWERTDELDSTGGSLPGAYHVRDRRALVLDSNHNATGSEMTVGERNSPNQHAFETFQGRLVRGNGQGNPRPNQANSSISRGNTTATSELGIVIEGQPYVPKSIKKKNSFPAAFVHLKHNRCKSLAVALLLLLVGITAILVIFLSQNKTQAQENMSSTDDMDAAIPTIMLSPTTAPSSQLTKKDGVKSSKSWRVIGNAIHGLQNESGMIISISSAGINWGYSEEKSNFTFSGFAVAVSSDGNVLAVGEPGTETVRTFNKHGDNWIQRGDILKGERLCENKIHEGGVRNLRNVEMNMEGHEPKFLPCYSAFGFDVDISGDGNTLAVGAIGYNDERGLLRTFEWDGTEWAQVGDDLQGDAIYDGFGGTVSVSDDGLTIAATSPQSIHPGFAKSLGISPFYGRGYGKVFDRIGKKWIQRGGTLRGNNSTDGMAAISMTGTGKMIALGTILGGYVEVFYWDEDARKWAPKGGLLDAPLGEADFGMPLALSKNGEILAVAADYKGDGVTTTDGYLIYVFEWDVASNSWNRRDRLVGLEAQAGRGFSISVSADGSVLGAAFGNGIQMYKWNEDSYYLIGSFGGYGRADLDLSDDGRTVAVGWPEDMSAGFGLGRTSVLRQERDLR